MSGSSSTNKSNLYAKITRLSRSCEESASSLSLALFRDDDLLLLVDVDELCRGVSDFLSFLFFRFSGFVSSLSGLERLFLETFKPTSCSSTGLFKEAHAGGGSAPPPLLLPLETITSSRGFFRFKDMTRSSLAFGPFSPPSEEEPEDEVDEEDNLRKQGPEL